MPGAAVRAGDVQQGRGPAALGTITVSQQARPIPIVVRVTHSSSEICLVKVWPRQIRARNGGRGQSSVIQPLTGPGQARSRPELKMIGPHISTIAAQALRMVMTTPRLTIVRGCCSR